MTRRQSSSNESFQRGVLGVGIYFRLKRDRLDKLSTRRGWVSFPRPSSPPGEAAA